MRCEVVDLSGLEKFLKEPLVMKPTPKRVSMASIMVDKVTVTQSGMCLPR